ncbi:MAG: SusC/RagA family TonB-linked outer membrane protein [Bacteroidetes bacterium]|nr:SusC/RagA family TonB-linked outer membrane protein [Bacteroidota bacterium]
MKKILTLFFLMVIFSSMKLLNAQSRIVNGTITDFKSAAPIAGVSVQVKGTNVTAKSAEDGNYAIVVPKGSTILVFTHLGHITIEAVITDDNIVNIKMEEDVQNLNEVVVTAVGIKREKKALGYAVQEVKGDAITKANNGNAMGALSGKVSGVQITSTSGTPGAATFIKVRGSNSFTGSNQPLIVVDGMPIDNSTSSVGEPDDLDNNELKNVNASNRGIDINPDDIENITVLKGAAAAALYGSNGANGVILITTKKGNGGSGNMSVSLNSGVTFDNVNKLPELQTKYLQGRNGEYAAPISAADPSHYRESWGPLGDTMYWNGDNTYLWDKKGYLVGQSDPSKKTKFTPYDNTGTFFKTGVTWNNNISIATATDRTSYRMSFGSLDQTGIIPNSTFKRSTFNLNIENKVSDKLTIGSSVNYTNSKGSFVQQGSNLSGIMLGLMRTPINFDNSNGVTDPTDPSAYMFADGQQRTYRGFGIYDNPYYTINENKYNSNTNRVYGNLFGVYKVNSWMTITNRLGTDMYTTNSQQNYGKLSSELAGIAEGRIGVRTESYNQVNNDLLITMTKQINKNLDMEVLVGNNIFSSKSLEDYSRGDNLIVSGWYNISNTKNFTIKQVQNSVFRRVSEYIQTKFNYKNYLYVDLTGRLENASSYLPASTGSNFYPSANLGYIFTEAFKMKSKKMNYGKLRLSVASVGKNPSVQSTTTLYVPTSVQDGWTSGWTSPFNGAPIFESTNLLNPKLKPEITSSREAGVELHFFKSRIKLDYTFYQTVSKNLLLLVPIAPSTGYSKYYTNAGEMSNWGQEVQLSSQIIRKKNFTWEATLNFSMNRNNVSKLAEGVNFLDLNGFEGSMVGVKLNQAYGVFYGQGYVRDDQGRVVINDDKSDPGYGTPLLSNKQEVLGNVNPRWLAGLYNQFTFKNFSFSFLFDTRQGGIMWNGTRGALASFGVAKETENRENSTKTFDGVYGHVGSDNKIYHYDGSNEVSGVGAQNTTAAKLDENYYRLGTGSGFNINEPYIENASWVKLREVALSYKVPAKFMKKMKIKSASMGFVGRNLLLFTKYKGVDPETSLTGASNAQGMDYFNNPGTRSWGFNVKLNF